MLVVSLLASCGEKEATSNSDGSAQASADEALSNVSQTSSDNNNETTSQSGDVMDDVTLGSLYTETDGKKDTYLKKYKGTNPVVTITSPADKTIRYVASSAFFNNNSVVEVTLPDTVEHIDSEAFSLCKSLEKVDLGNGVKEIEKNVFLQCVKLKHVNLGNSIEKIGDTAFITCLSLEEIIIPPSCTEISDNAFAGTAENFKIKGEKRSYAETYANELNIPFEEYSFS